MAKIMVVDDDLALRSLLVRVLRGYDVCVYNNGASALEDYVKGEIPDLVATDFDMPGMTGGEFIGQLREKGYNGKIILMSGKPENESAEGYDLFLPKPVDVSDFRYHVAVFIDPSVPKVMYVGDMLPGMNGYAVKRYEGFLDALTDLTFGTMVPDVFVGDLSRFDDMDVGELFFDMRESDYKGPVVLLGEGEKPDVRCDLYLKKPVDRNELMERIDGFS